MGKWKKEELHKHGELKIADLTVWARFAGSHTGALGDSAGPFKGRPQELKG